MTDTTVPAALPSGNGATAPTPPTLDTLVQMCRGRERLERDEGWTEEAELWGWLAGSLPEMMAAQAENSRLREAMRRCSRCENTWRLAESERQCREFQAARAASSVPSSETPTRG